MPRTMNGKCQRPFARRPLLVVRNYGFETCSEMLASRSNVYFCSQAW
jgi:hypothetical protein